MSKLKWIEQKIIQQNELISFCKRQRVKSRKIVFTNGCFDILHQGHIDVLAKAADQGNVLIVGLNSDSSVRQLKGSERPINREEDRALMLASLLCVDAVCIFEEATPLKLIEIIQPDVLVKGGDYQKEQIVGSQEVEARGGTVVIVPFVQGYSTSGLVEKIKGL